MTKRGAGDHNPQSAVRNRKERDRYAVVTNTLQQLKERLKMAGGNHTHILQYTLVALRRLKADNAQKTAERARLYQSLGWPIPASRPAPNHCQQHDPHQEGLVPVGSPIPAAVMANRPHPLHYPQRFPQFQLAPCQVPWNGHPPASYMLPPAPHLDPYFLQNLPVSPILESVQEAAHSPGPIEEAQRVIEEAAILEELFTQPTAGPI